MTTVFRGAGLFDRLPPGTKGLLIANGAAFLAQNIVPGFMMTVFALSVDSLIHKYWIWQILTYAFLHGNFWHLFFNMFVLWMFGPHIELYWGSKTFIRYYFLCVLGAALTQIAVAPPDSFMVGASGGLYGLFIAFGLLFPDAVIYFFFVFPMRAIQAAIVMAILTFASSLNAGGSHIAHVAHFGGLATGFLYFKVPVWLLPFRNLFRRFRRHDSPQFHVMGFEDESDKLRHEVDRILDKISSHGIGSLTEKEQATMREYSERNK